MKKLGGFCCCCCTYFFIFYFHKHLAYSNDSSLQLMILCFLNGLRREAALRRTIILNNCVCYLVCLVFILSAPQCRAAEIKVPSYENTELKDSSFKAWSRSVYCHACYAYCQGFLPCSLLFRSIHLHFSKTSPEFFLC